MPDVPTDGANLVLKAAAAFRQRPNTGAPYVHFVLGKSVPAGAGLGGGSSDAATALLGLNQLAPRPLTGAELRACAAEVRFRCPLVFGKRPGGHARPRGQSRTLAGRRRRRVGRARASWFLNPAFGIPTAWAYGRMRALAPQAYLPAGAAEKKMTDWLRRPSWETLPLENNLELPAFEKYLALPALLGELRKKFNLRCRMSGSGSACFALLEPASPRPEIIRAIRDAWGPSAVIQLTQLAGSSTV